jgi:hypothetical protein
MTDIPIWPGSSSFTTGSTPFGYFDSDAQFLSDAPKVVLYITFPEKSINLRDVALTDKASKFA